MIMIKFHYYLASTLRESSAFRGYSWQIEMNNCIRCFWRYLPATIPLSQTRMQLKATAIFCIAHKNSKLWTVWEFPRLIECVCGWLLSHARRSDKFEGKPLRGRRRPVQIPTCKSRPSWGLISGPPLWLSCIFWWWRHANRLYRQQMHISPNALTSWPSSWVKLPTASPTTQSLSIPSSQNPTPPRPPLFAACQTESAEPD